MSGGGIIIGQRAAIKQAVNDPSIFGALPQQCQDRVTDINAKGLHDWTDAEDSFMRTMPLLAKHC